MNSGSDFTNSFVSFSRQKLVGEMWPRLCTCLDGLSDEQIWWRPNDTSNSIGNLLLHLNGNVRQWLLQSIGGVENLRDRDSEFNARDVIAVAELRSALQDTIGRVDTLFQRLTPDDLLRTYDIQIYKEISALQAIYHVVEHFAMHYGQILYISKLLRGEDLAFYPELSNRSSTLPKPDTAAECQTSRPGVHQR